MDTIVRNYIEKKIDTLPRFFGEFLVNAIREGAEHKDIQDMLKNGLGMAERGILVAQSTAAMLILPAVKKIDLSMLFRGTDCSVWTNCIGLLELSSIKNVRIVVGEGTVYMESSGEELHSFQKYQIEIVQKNIYNKLIIRQAADNNGWIGNDVEPELKATNVELYSLLLKFNSLCASYNEVSRKFQEIQLEN